MTTHPRRPGEPPPLPQIGDTRGGDLCLANLRRSYRVKSDARRRDRRNGVLLLIALALGLTIAAWVWGVKAEGTAPEPSPAPTAAQPATPTEGVFDALTEWCKVAPKNPLRHAEYRREVARALVAGAAAHDLPVELVTAMSLRESSGAQDAVGTRGELGLMQVLPGTAVAFHCRLETPAEQVECGCRVLARTAERCGSLRGGLVAYGSGSGRCHAKPGGRVERMVNDRLRFAEKLKTIIQGGTP